MDHIRLDKNVLRDYRKGQYHGPCNDHWPKNSIAAITGLLRLGINRLPFRDEVDKDGRIHRLFGRYRSIVIYYEEEPALDKSNGVGFLDRDRLTWLAKGSDYKDCSPDVLASRYCP